MTTRVAFLRAINVGNRRVAMERLREVVADAGFTSVSTFIASGNVIFDAAGSAAALEDRLEDAVRDGLGYDAPAFVRTTSQIASIVAKTPFRDEPDRLVQIGFLKNAPSPSARVALEDLGGGTDQVRVVGREIHWLAPDGVGRSKVGGASFEKILGGPTTMRSLKMLHSLLDKLAAL